MGSALASGYYSAAMGYSAAHATNDGAFVWADVSSENYFASSGTNQFLIRAAGGVGINTNNPNGAALAVNGNQTISGNLSFDSQTRQMLNLFGTTYGIGVQFDSLYFRCANFDANSGFSWYKGGVHNDGLTNAGGGTEMMHLVASGLYVNGTFVSSSDRNAKENFMPIQPRDVLEKVVALPLSSWNYKADTATRHVGPMAQDFYAAFNLGPDDKHIATVDADGVALAAIQGLNQKLEEQRAENTELKARLERLERLLNARNGGDK
jgi:hypothetical protein